MEHKYIQEHTDIHTFKTLWRSKPHFAQGYALEIKRGIKWFILLYLERILGILILEVIFLNSSVSFVTN